MQKSKELYLVNYYLAVDAEEFIGISEDDEANGTMASPTNHSIFITVLQMKKALKKAYPIALPEGSDGRVIAVCDSCYRCSKYPNGKGETICTLRLIRTYQDGSHVLSSRQIKMYCFSKI